MIIEMATNHAGMCDRFGMITYNLDSSIKYAKMQKDRVQRVEYNSDHRDGYKPCRHVR